jgi:hypothetical protein
MTENLWDKFWHDDEGNTVIWQTPNAFLIIWVILTIVSLLVSGKTADVLSFIGWASLIIWSVLEVWKGVNYFRRLLGLIVFVLSALSFVHVL